MGAGHNNCGYGADGGAGGVVRVSIVPLIVCVLLPHSVLCFIETLAQLCELARADDVLIISL